MEEVTVYDDTILNWFSGNSKKKYDLRYGENPHQKAIALVSNDKFTQLSGDKKLSYNNLLDLDAGIKIAYGIKTNNNICTIIKHNTPCGASIRKTQTECYQQALAGDPVSSFGEIVCFNKTEYKKTASLLINNHSDIISPPNFNHKQIKNL